MSFSLHARCPGCNQLTYCELCGNAVETLPVLDNEIITVCGLAVCSDCFADSCTRENEVHPLTTKHGRFFSGKLKKDL
jgi:hypothetical protein